MQRKYCFYSSSLLVAYDAQHLRQHCSLKVDSSVSHSAPKFDKEMICESVPLLTVPGMHRNSSEMDDLTFRSKMKKSISQPMSMSSEENIPTQSETCNLNVDRLCRSSPSQFSLSCTNNTQNDDESTEDKWVRVKMIDFTHVFPGENNDLDRNYRDGIQMLIQLLSLIKKSDCMH